MGTYNHWLRESYVNRYVKNELEDRYDPSNKRAFWKIIMGFAEKSLSDSNKSPKGLLVDIGCGPGITAADFIKRFGFKELLAIDVSEPMLDCVPWYIDIEVIRTTFQKADITKCQFKAKDSTADLAISCRVLVYAEELENIFKETARVLKQGGHFGFNCYVHKEVSQETHRCEDLSYPMPVFAHSKVRLQALAKKYGLILINERIKPENDVDCSIAIQSAILFFRKK